VLPALPHAAVPRRTIAVLSTLALLAAALVAGIAPAKAAASELFFSEYVEGSSNNKALEIYNGTGASVNLSGYTLELYSNGATTASQSMTLSGTLANADVYVLAHPSAAAAIIAVADATNGSVINWNGDDAIVLRKAGTVVDAIGQVGFDPGTEWGTGLVSTADNTIRRKSTVQTGDTNTGDAFSPAAEWDGFATDTFDGLGAHVFVGDDRPVVSQSSPASNAVDVALNANLGVTFNEPVTLTDSALSLQCTKTGTHATDRTGNGTTYSFDPVVDFGFGEKCTATITASAVSDADGKNMAADYIWSFTTVPPPPSCDDPQTTISQVQGAAETSPVAGKVVTVEAVVTAVRPSLNGFFIEEETGDRDTSASTSEGVFVRAPAPAGTAPGDVVQATGGVREFPGSANGVASSQTQISDRVTVLACGSAPVPAPVTIQFPVAAVSDLEHVEGMQVTLPQELVISEYFNFARFNETVVGLPPNGRDRFDTPTAVQEPSTAGTQALLADYAKRRITVDDGRGSQNSSPPYFPGTVNTPFTLGNSFRGGDTLTGITGVVEHTFGLYRVHPTADATYTRKNPRPQTPPSVGDGDVKVASFNVLNNFLTPDGNPGDDSNNLPADDVCGGNTNLDCRGHDAGEPTELARQRAKIVDAIKRLDADVVGLMEMENTPGVEPAADLVAGLNAATAPGTYDFIDTGVIGTDAIRLGFLYKPGTVTPVGDFAVLDSSVDPDFLDTRNRPSLAQTFRQNGTPDQVTVAVNHLKSKGSECSGDPDTGDGAGNCNVTRTKAARALVKWLATDPTGSGDSDSLIIGDLNSYDHEDPIDAIVAAGYTDTIKKFGGEYAHSYVFDGQVGYLDHGLASASLLPQVTGAADWHINSDEPSILDYDTSFKAAPEEAIYEPNAFRASDHDPVLVGMDLGRCQFADDEDTMVRTLLGDCTTRTTVRVPDGWTLDGNGFTVTAVDVPGTAFLGAVVANAGQSANVRDLTVTTYELANVCSEGTDQQDRLRGILLDRASGTISGNNVIAINQGESGCQEGNAIEVRNAPFDTTGPDVSVTITDNVVNDYQKTGILVNGSVQATLTGNDVSGLGPVNYIAQNGVQISRGATATVDGNRIADNWYIGSADAVSCGLLAFQADGLKQKRNVFVANQQDFCNVGRGGGGVS
jgi:predicted extracellular nuclease